VNKYLHTVTSVGFLFTLNYDARNHELKIERKGISEEGKNNKSTRTEAVE